MRFAQAAAVEAEDTSPPWEDTPASDAGAVLPDAETQDALESVEASAAAGSGDVGAIPADLTSLDGGASEEAQAVESGGDEAPVAEEQPEQAVHEAA
jgi:hypothetical protein